MPFLANKGNYSEHHQWSEVLLRSGHHVTKKVTLFEFSIIKLKPSAIIFRSIQCGANSQLIISFSSSIRPYPSSIRSYPIATPSAIAFSPQSCPLLSASVIAHTPTSHLEPYSECHFIVPQIKILPGWECCIL